MTNPICVLSPADYARREEFARGKVCDVCLGDGWMKHSPSPFTPPTKMECWCCHGTGFIRERVTGWVGMEQPPEDTRTRFT